MDCDYTALIDFKWFAFCLKKWLNGVNSSREYPLHPNKHNISIYYMRQVQEFAVNKQKHKNISTRDY